MVYNREIEYIRSTLKGARQNIHNLTGVLGTGITHSRVTGIGSGHQLVVYLEQYNKNIIDKLPSSVGGIDVVYQVIGKVKALHLVSQRIGHTLGCSANPGNTGCTCTGQTAEFPERIRPIRAGASVGNVNILEAGYCDTGTLGGFPKLADGTPVILSNNHVLAHDNPWIRVASVGDKILQPGTLDTADTSTDTVATLQKWKSIPNKADGTIKVDYAISGAINSDISVNYTGLCDYPINATVAPVVGMSVKKSGRTTGCTTGTIQAIDVTVDVDYNPTSTTSLARFVGQIQTTNMSSGGDSGSVVVTNDGNNNAVGLLFAGGSSATFSNVMSDIEQESGASFGGTPPPPPPPGKKYKCSGAPDYICSEDPNGTYNSLSECQNACQETPPPQQYYGCDQTSNTCVTCTPGSGSGIRSTSLTDCQIKCNDAVEQCLINCGSTDMDCYNKCVAEYTQCLLNCNDNPPPPPPPPSEWCKYTEPTCGGVCSSPPPPPPGKKYKCSGAPNYICSEDPNGTYSSLTECQNACTSTPPPPPPPPPPSGNELMNAIYVLIIAIVLIAITMA